MVPYNYTEFIDGLTYLVKSNVIPISRIDDAVKRILRVKFIMGLFENPLADSTFVNELGKKVLIYIHKVVNIKIRDTEMFQIYFFIYNRSTEN